MSVLGIVTDAAILDAAASVIYCRTIRSIYAREGDPTMRMHEFLKGEAVAVENCPMRSRCPIGSVCMAGKGQGDHPLFPTIVEVAQGDLLWTDLRSEQRVFILRSGVYSCVAHVGSAFEIPFALYGSGAAIGLAELYIPRTTADTYHLRTLVSGTVCAVLAKPLRRHLEELPDPLPQQILSRSLVDMSTAALVQSMVVSKPLLHDRTTLLIAVLHELAARGGSSVEALHITHDEIARIVASDRASVTRLLNKLEQQGVVELGYRSITLKDKDAAFAEEAAEVCSMFFPL